MSFWVLEWGNPVAPRGPVIVKTGTTVSTQPEALRGFVDSNALQDLKEGLQAFGGLQIQEKS